MELYASYRLAQVICRVLPRRFAYWLGLRIADHYYALDHAGRQAVMSNYRQILHAQGIAASEATLQRMARANFQYFGKYLVDFFKFSRFDMRHVRRLVSLEHVEHLSAAEQRERGVILITAHLGNWELGGAVISAMGHRLSVVVMPERISKVNRLFQKHRTQRGVQVIPFGQAARGVLRALKTREWVGMLADRDYTAHNEPIEFFGRPARLPSGPARIAAKTGAPIVPVFLLRQPDDTFIFRCHSPIIPEECPSVQAIRGLIRDALEKEIARAPLQWFMFDDFWRPRQQHDVQPA